jgi:hypothetical protein
MVMRYLKMFGLAVVAAVVAMAFVGAGSASATVVCKTTPVNTDCGVSWEVITNQSVEASSEEKTSVVFEDTSGHSVSTCGNGGYKGMLTNSGSKTETARGFTEEFTFSGCVAAVKVIMPGTFEIHANDSNQGTFTGSEMYVTVSSTLTGSCVYGTSGTLPIGTMQGGKIATFNLNAAFEKTEGGFACPASVRWTATYKITKPENLYFATT